MMEYRKFEGRGVLRASANWKKLYFYQKADALYQLTVVFCERFLPDHGDRTVDQMVQAARSGKQNIVEGSEDGKTSTEMELKLLNVARASVAELTEDYKDFINSRKLTMWSPGHPRYEGMLAYTSTHNQPEDYLELCKRWNEEEFGNTALTLCYQTDAMMNKYLKLLERRFVEEGGIKERMHKARTGYRAEQDKQQQQLEEENKGLREQVKRLEERVRELEGEREERGDR